MADLSGLRVTVVVMGDLGRSPRMQYHAVSLAQSGAEVAVLALDGKPPLAALAHPSITLRLLKEKPRRGGFAVATLLRWRAQSWFLLRALLSGRRPHLILIQNPPSFPALPLALLAAALRDVAVVIDWHNTTEAMASLRLGKRSLLVRAIGSLERFLGRRAEAHLAVSELFRARLQEEGLRKVTTFRDQPWRLHRPDGAARARAANRLRERFAPGADRVSLVAVTTSSWSADEDFGFLLKALAQAGAALEGTEARILMLATGDGPRRRSFEEEAARVVSGRIIVATDWLSEEEYWEALAGADLGISLHRSAGGFDLPMKIADMLGAALPVCAIDYGPVLGERLREGVDGFLVSTPSALGAILSGSIRNGAQRELLESMRDRLVAGVIRTWEEEWRTIVMPLVSQWMRPRKEVR